MQYYDMLMSAQFREQLVCCKHARMASEIFKPRVDKGTEVAGALSLWMLVTDASTARAPFHGGERSGGLSSVLAGIPTVPHDAAAPRAVFSHPPSVPYVSASTPNGVRCKLP